MPSLRPVDTDAEIWSGKWISDERRFALPVSDNSVTEWADKRRILLSRTSAEPGPWRTARAPYLKAIMDSFSNPGIEEIVFCKARQVGASESLLNMLGYIIEHEPAPTLMVQPTLELAVWFSRNRFTPMVDAIPSLYQRKSPDVDEYTLQEMIFAGMVLTIGGANSPATLISRPIRFLLFDEIDTYPLFSGRAGTPIGVATECTRTFWNRKIVKVSTPTTLTGNIWSAHQAAGLRYEYYVPCPHCGEYQTLIFWGDDPKKKEYYLRWHEPDEDYDIEDVFESTWYECRFCKGRIVDRDKPKMLEAGEWRDQEGETFENHDGRSRSVSFHVNTLYSPWVTFGEMAVKFLKSKDNPEEFVNFVNLWLGLPIKELVTESLPEEIEAQIADYEPGVIPAGAITLIATVDIQKYYLQFVLRAWSFDMESWLIREGQVETFDDLREIVIDSSYPVAGTDDRMMVRIALIDAGFRTDEVYDFIRKFPKTCRATKGASHTLRAPYSASKLDTYPDGKRMAEGVTLWMFDTSYWKDALVRRMMLSVGEEARATKWHVYPGVTAAYASQLTAEEKVLVRNRRTGQSSEIWQLRQGKKRNEAFDLEVMNLMGADMVGIRFFAPRESSIPGAPAIKKAVPRPIARSNWMKPR